MNYDFSAFNSDGNPRQAVATGWRARVRHASWFVAAGLLAIVLLPVAASSPEDMRKLEAVAQLQAKEQANPWLAEERRLLVVIAEIKQRHMQFDRDQPVYSQAVVDDTRELMVRYIAQGVAPSRALTLAVQDVELEGLPQLVLAE
jgi:hypothetical protein